MGNTNSRRYGEPFYPGGGYPQRRHTFPAGYPMMGGMNGMNGMSAMPNGGAMAQNEMLAQNGMMIPGMMNTGYMANGAVGPVLPQDAFQAAQNGYPSYQYQPKKKKKRRPTATTGLTPRPGWESGYVSGIMAGMGVNGQRPSQQPPQSYNPYPQQIPQNTQAQPYAQPQVSQTYAMQVPEMTYGRSARHDYPFTNSQGGVVPPIPQPQQSHPNPSFQPLHQMPPQSMPPPQPHIVPTQSMPQNIPVSHEPPRRHSTTDLHALNPTPRRAPNPLPRAPREVLDSPRYAAVRDLIRTSRMESRRATQEHERERERDRAEREDRFAGERLREQGRERDRVSPSSRVGHGRYTSESALGGASLVGPYNSASVREQTEQPTTGRTGLFGLGGRSKGKGFLSGFVSNNRPSQAQAQAGPSNTQARASIERRRTPAPGRGSPVEPRYTRGESAGLNTDASNVISPNGVFVPADSLPGGVSPRLRAQTFGAHQAPSPNETPRFGGAGYALPSRAPSNVTGPYNRHGISRSSSETSFSDEDDEDSLRSGVLRSRDGGMYNAPPPAAYMTSGGPQHITPGPPPPQTLSPNAIPPSHLNPHPPNRPPVSMPTASSAPIHVSPTNVHRDLLPVSPHRVLYRDMLYLTAQHLFEALKFVDTFPEILTRLQTCSLEELPRIVGGALDRAVSGWEGMQESMMEKALYAKYTQHNNLRMQLVETGQCLLVNADPNDPHWGHGPDGRGHNVLGQIMMTVRSHIRRDMGLQD